MNKCSMSDKFSSLFLSYQLLENLVEDKHDKRESIKTSLFLVSNILSDITNVSCPEEWTDEELSFIMKVSNELSGESV